jgi:shikimate dehydrogenase
MIHGHWIAALGLDAEYGRREVTPETLPVLLEDVRTGAVHGANLTVPLKEAVVPLLDRLTPEAKAMGAVNTIFMADGALTGANTDVPGFFAHLDEAAPGWSSAPGDALVLGAGGAARAIAYGLIRRGLGQVKICNRSPERARALAEGLGGKAASIAWPPAANELGEARLIVNATSLGMKGQPPLALEWPPRLDGRIACDIVYDPLETGFLMEARARGASCVDGLGMLLHQAALAFGCWFGTAPAVTPALRALVEADLRAPGPRG